MKEEKTICIGLQKHVGWFRGKINSQPEKIYVALSEYRDDPSMGEWMTISETRKLRNALTKILDHHVGANPEAKPGSEDQ